MLLFKKEGESWLDFYAWMEVKKKEREEELNEFLSKEEHFTWTGCNNLGLHYSKTRMLDEAIECYEHALQILEEQKLINGKVLSNFGVVFVKKREFDLAKKFFQCALAADPLDCELCKI